MAKNITKASDKAGGPPQWTYVAGSIVGILGFVWAVVSVFLPKTESPPKGPIAPAASEQKAEANGGTAINAAGNASVSIGNDVAPISAGVPVAPTSVPTSQSAKAGSDGTAVNATDSAAVVVKKP